MFSDEFILKYNMYVCFPGHVGMSGGMWTHECFGGRSKSWRESLPNGRYLLIEIRGSEDDHKEQEGMVDTESGKGEKQLVRGNGRPLQRTEEGKSGHDGPSESRKQFLKRKCLSRQCRERSCFCWGELL